ncbi:MAG: hypothetical protein IPP74_15520 [Alphaproteobacteria bacterium]|nr:hypothetical protein [Alphaproteobacteria bacterium]
MAFKVVDVTTTSKETASEIDLFSDLTLDRDTKKQIQQDVGEFLVEKILESVSSRTSPIAGGTYKKTLSPEYKKHKQAEGGSSVADLKLTGIMLDELGFKKTEDGILLGVFGDAAPRADGHSNLSGESTLPERKFLPNIDEEFKSSIQSGVERIIADAIADSVDLDRSDFEGVDSTDDLYEVLSDEMPDMTRAEIRAAIYRNEALTELLESLGLLDDL